MPPPPGDPPHLKAWLTGALRRQYNSASPGAGLGGVQLVFTNLALREVRAYTHPHVYTHAYAYTHAQTCMHTCPHPLPVPDFCAEMSHLDGPLSEEDRCLAPGNRRKPQGTWHSSQPHKQELCGCDPISVRWHCTQDPSCSVHPGQPPQDPWEQRAEIGLWSLGSGNPWWGLQRHHTSLPHPPHVFGKAQVGLDHLSCPQAMTGVQPGALTWTCPPNSAPLGLSFCT